MIINTILFLTVVSFIGKYEGVHCSRYLDCYLNIKVEDFESFSINCHLVMYNIINRRIYKNQTIIKLPIEEFQNRMKEYLIRLHRIYYHGDNSKLKDIRKYIWIFYWKFHVWTKNKTPDYMKEMEEYTEILISEGNKAEIWDDKSGSEIMNDYIYCTDRLEILSRKSEEEIFTEELNKIFYNEGSKYKMHPNNENTELPVSIEYGFILLLLKREEKQDFMSSSDEKEKKIFVVDMMKEALLNTFFTITKVLKEIGPVVFTAKQIRCIEYKDDEIIVKLMILKSLFIKIIDATEAVFNIQEDRKNYSGILTYKFDAIRTSKTISLVREALKKNCRASSIDPGTLQLYPDLKKEYNIYMDIVKAKLNQICPELAKDENKRSEDHILTKEIEKLFPDRLIINNSIRVSLLSCYSVYSPDIYVEPFLEELLDAKDSITLLLLELNAWIPNIKQYANLMKNGMSSEHKTQDTIMDQTQRFIDDREFLKGFECI